MFYCQYYYITHSNECQTNLCEFFNFFRAIKSHTNIKRRTYKPDRAAARKFFNAAQKFSNAARIKLKI